MPFRTPLDADAAKELKPLVTRLVDQLRGLISLVSLQDPTFPFGEVGKNLTLTGKGKTYTVQTLLSGKTIEAVVNPPKK